MSNLEQDYRRVGAGRMRARREHGKLIELEDSSSWQISPDHEIYTEHWTPESEITVVPGSYTGYPYDLINLNNGDRVPAKYLGFSDADFGWSLVDDH